MIPVALVAIVMALKFIPAHVKESKESVDNIGGILSMVLVGSLIMAINFAPVPGMGTLVLGLTAVVVVALIFFIIRQRRAKNPLYDLKVAARPTFWVAAVGGIIVFGSLMGAMFLGQQFMQNVLGYGTVAAGASILPAAVFMILVAPRSAKLVQARGSRFTLILSFAAVFIAFVLMLLLWKEGIPYWMVGDRLYLPRHRRRAGRHAFFEFADGLGAGDARGHGVGHGGLAARSGWRIDAVDLRSAVSRRVCRVDGDCDCDRAYRRSTGHDGQRAEST